MALRWGGSRRGLVYHVRARVSGSNATTAYDEEVLLAAANATAVVPIATRRLLINLNGVHDTGNEPVDLVWYLFALATSYYLWALAMTVADRSVTKRPCVTLSIFFSTVAPG